MSKLPNKEEITHLQDMADNCSWAYDPEQAKQLLSRIKSQNELLDECEAVVDILNTISKGANPAIKELLTKLQERKT